MPATCPSRHKQTWNLQCSFCSSSCVQLQGLHATGRCCSPLWVLTLSLAVPADPELAALQPRRAPEPPAKIVCSIMIGSVATVVHLQACSLCRTLSAQHVQQLSWLPAAQRLAITPRGGPSSQGWRLESCWLPLLCGGCSYAGDRSVCHLSVQRCFSVCHAYPLRLQLLKP